MLTTLKLLKPTNFTNFSAATATDRVTAAGPVPCAVAASRPGRVSRWDDSRSSESSSAAAATTWFQADFMGTSCVCIYIYMDRYIDIWYWYYDGLSLHIMWISWDCQLNGLNKSPTIIFDWNVDSQVHGCWYQTCWVIHWGTVGRGWAEVTDLCIVWVWKRWSLTNN